MKIHTLPRFAALAALTFGLWAWPASLPAQTTPTTEVQQRVAKLLSQMTLDEKLMLIHGTKEHPATAQGQAGFLLGVPRLGIPGLRLADGPPGVLTRVPSQAETATMGVAATFSRKLAEANGVVIGREDRALGIDISLQPFVNIVRDLEFNRAYNTFGEDPYLTAEIGAYQVKGIQSQQVMAQIKHYVGYDSQNLNVLMDDQTLHEIYLAPFDAAIRKANVASIMCSYNKLNGAYACGNDSVLTKILRQELGFEGFVTSDWGAVHALNFLKAGLDMEMPGDAAAAMMPSFFDTLPRPAPRVGGAANVGGFSSGPLPEEPVTKPHSNPTRGDILDPRKMTDGLKDGLVTEADVDRAAGRILTTMIRFGYLDGQSKHEVTRQAVAENAKIIEETGEASAILLKNEGALLPLKEGNLASTVLIGPTALQVDAIGLAGERSVGLVERQIGPLMALKKVSAKQAIPFAVANDMTGHPIPASLLSHDGQPGLLCAAGTATQVDAQIDFAGNKALPANATATWKGALKVPTAGNYWIYLQALGANAFLTIDGAPFSKTSATQGGMHGSTLQANQDNILPTTDGLDNVRKAVELTAGEHTIEVSITPDTSNAPAQIRLNWYTPEQRKADFDAAVAAAKAAKTAVVFVWSRGNPVFALPGDQDKLVEAVAAVNPNTVVVLNTSMPVDLPWVGKVKSILQMGWAGDEGGWSTANLLLGKDSPAGRLPITWARQLTDYPATDPRYPERSSEGVDGKTTYSEGVHVGYRWFDQQKIEPLFPFGHGLSYTSFAYSDLKVAKAADGGLDVTLAIRNTGKVSADEVPQLYLGAPEKAPEGAQFPVRALVGFDRVSIAAGASQTVTLHVDERQLQYWSTKEGKWLKPAGKRLLSVGASSRDLRLSQTIE